MSFAHPLNIDFDFRESLRHRHPSTWRICLFTGHVMGRIFPSAWRTKREAKKRIGNPPPGRTRGLGVPVTKKIEDSWRECAGGRDREKEEGAFVGRKREIEVSAGGYGGGTTIVVLSPVNKGWVTPPGVPEAGRRRERKTPWDPDFRLLPFTSSRSSVVQPVAWRNLCVHTEFATRVRVRFMYVRVYI